MALGASNPRNAVVEATSEVRAAALPLRYKSSFENPPRFPSTPLLLGGREASFGRASFTFKVAPPTGYRRGCGLPLPLFIVGISTKAKPRARPVSRSFTRLTAE